MQEPDIHFTDKLADDFHTDFVPAISKDLDASYVASGVKQLLQNCKIAHPLPLWDELAAVPHEEDAESILQLLREAGESKPGGSWQLMLADPTSTTTKGKLLLFADLPEHLTHTSTFAAAVEQAISDQPEDVQDWGRWHLIVGYLGLIVLQHLSPLQPVTPTPDMFGDDDDDNGTLYGVGVEDHANFFIGLKSDNDFIPTLEWN